jgi:hypothetical protein
MKKIYMENSFVFIDFFCNPFENALNFEILQQDFNLQSFSCS